MKRLTAALGSLSLALGAAACTVDEATDPAPAGAAAPAETTAAPTTTEAPAGGVTLAQFSQVAPGMAYADVVALFGAEGKLTSSFETPSFTGGPPTRSETFSWDGNEWLSSAIISFEDGLVTMTAQFGLS